MSIYGFAKGTEFEKVAAASAKGKYLPLAEKVRAAGCPEAAAEIERFAEEEAHHGVVLANILKKYAPQAQ